MTDKKKLDFGLSEALKKSIQPFTMEEQLAVNIPGQYNDFRSSGHPELAKILDTPLPFAPEGLSQAIINNPVMDEIFGGFVRPAEKAASGQLLGFGDVVNAAISAVPGTLKVGAKPGKNIAQNVVGKFKSSRAKQWEKEDEQVTQETMDYFNHLRSKGKSRDEAAKHATDLYYRKLNKLRKQRWEQMDPEEIYRQQERTNDLTAKHEFLQELFKASNSASRQNFLARWRDYLTDNQATKEDQEYVNTYIDEKIAYHEGRGKKPRTPLKNPFSIKSQKAAKRGKEIDKLWAKERKQRKKMEKNLKFYDPLGSTAERMKREDLQEELARLHSRTLEDAHKFKIK